MKVTTATLRKKAADMVADLHLEELSSSVQMSLLNAWTDEERVALLDLTSSIKGMEDAGVDMHDPTFKNIITEKTLTHMIAEEAVATLNKLIYGNTDIQTDTTGHSEGG